jgi:lysozyme family protein
MIVYLNTDSGIEYADATPKKVKHVDILVQGAIYNHRTVIDAYAGGGNIETAIVNMYMKHGFRYAMFMLDGEFTVVLYDRTSNEVYASRDPYGLCFLSVIPPIIGSSTWAITDKNTMVKPMMIGTYSMLCLDEHSGVWKLVNAEERYHSIPLYSRKIVKTPLSLTALSFHYFQYLKHAIQKRIVPNKTYYLNYDASRDMQCFMISWIMFQLYPSMNFSIYVNDYNEVSSQWHEVFGEKIRMYSLNYDSNTTVEISAEDILIANQVGEDESGLLYEIRKRIELYNGLPHRVGHINSIRPFMDAALIDFYLKEVPTEMRMSNALFREDDSMLALLPYMLCRV